MENYQDEVSPKRQRNTTNEDGPPRKSHRSELPNQQALSLPTKIIDLNDDCLKKVFARLNLNNLFSVALANEWLRPAAADVYRKFGTKQVIIHGCEDICHFIYNVPEEFGDCIHIYGLKMALQYLRCFGPSIRCLSIDYDKSQSQRYQRVLDYVSNYCEVSLVNVLFNSLLESSMPHFEKKLINITSITIQDSILTKHLLSFAESCPNVQNLELYDVCLERNFNAAAFKRLQHLSIRSAFCISNYSVNGAYSKLLCLNSQLQSIELETSYNGWMTMETLLQMIKNNVAINKLFVTTHSIQFSVDISEVQQLAKEHPSLAELDLRGYHFTVDNVIEMIQQLSALKKFNFLKQNTAEREVQLNCSELETKLKGQWVAEGKCCGRSSYYIQLYRKN